MQNLSGQLRNVERNFEQTFNKVQSITKGLNVRQLEDTFKTSFKNIGDAGIESFASIQAAGAGFYAAQAALQAKRTIVSSLTAANVAASTGPKAEVAETARFEKIRADALLASRNAFKEFEQTVRSGGKNISGSLAANAASATALGSSLSAVIGIAKSLGLVLGPLAILSFAKGAFTAVGAVQDLADSSGIAADMLFKLKPVMEAAGSSAEELARIVNIMQAKIVEGSAETVTTLGKLGISMSEALALADDPEGLLDKLAKGLANVATQAERVNIEKDIGGRGAVKALETLANPRGLQPIRDQKPLISNEEIAAIDKAGDALNTLRIKLEALVAVKVIPLVDGFIALHDIVTKIGNPIEGIGDAIQKALEKTFPWVALLLKAGEAVGIIGKNAKELQATTNSTTFRDFPAATQGSKVDLSQATFTLPGAAVTAPGKVESDQQKLFNKSLEETVDGLRAQTRALTEAGDAATDHAAKILEAKAVTLGFAKGSAELTAKLNEFKAATLELKQATFADSLIKQNQAIEVQIATMTQGAEAGQRLALQYAINNARLGQMSKASRDAADAQGVLNKKLAEAVIPQAQKALTDDTTEARQRVEIQGPTFNIAAATRDAKQKFIDAMLAVRGSPELKALAFEAVLKVIPELQRDKLVAIKAELANAFTEAEDKGAALNRVFGNTFDVGAAKLDKMRETLAALVIEARKAADIVKQQELALGQAKTDKSVPNQSSVNLISSSGFSAADKENMTAALAEISSSSKVAGADIEKMTAELDAARKTSDAFNASMQKLSAATDAAEIKDAFEKIKRDIAIAENQALLFGNAFDLAGAKVQAVQSALQGLTVKGITAANPAAQQIAGQLSAQKLSATLSDLRKEMALSAAEAQVLGGAINLPAETIGSLTNAIKILVKEFGPLHPELQQLKIELEAANKAADLADGFKSMAGAAVDAINDLSNGASLKDALKNLASKISAAITDALVTKPLQRMIDKWVNEMTLPEGIFGGIFGGGKKEAPIPEGTFRRFPAPTTAQPGDASQGEIFVPGDKTPGVGTGAIPGSEAAIAAIQAQTTTATTAITALQTEATTALQLTSTEGTTAITTTGNTAQVAIEAMKVEAIAAIQAMAAQNGGGVPGAGGGAGGLLGSLFGGGGSSGPEVGYGGTSLIEDVFSYHTGGKVGAMGFANRSVDARAFAYAPRYHTGIDYAGGEMPAILKRGEEVGWPDKLAEKYGGGGKVINYNQTVYAKDAGSFRTSKRAIFGQARNAFQNLD